MSVGPDHAPPLAVEDLTPRQREVLALLARGSTNFEIAEELGISLEGAKYHVREIMGRLGVESRDEAALWWKRERRPAMRVRRGLGWLAPRFVIVAALIASLSLAAVVVAVGIAARGGGKPAAAYVPVCGEGDVSLALESELRDKSLGQYEDPSVTVRVRLSTKARCYLNGQLTLGPEPFDWNSSAMFPASTDFDTLLDGEAVTTFSVERWCDAYIGTELTARIGGATAKTRLGLPAGSCDALKTPRCLDDSGPVACPARPDYPTTMIGQGSRASSGWMDLLDRCNPARLRVGIETNLPPRPQLAASQLPPDGATSFVLTWALPERPIDCEFASAMTVRLIDANGRELDIAGAVEGSPFVVRLRRATLPETGHASMADVHLPGTGGRGDYASETTLVSLAEGTRWAWVNWCGEDRSPVTVEITTAVGRVAGLLERPACIDARQRTILGPG